jgi:putative membrane protein
MKLTTVAISLALLVPAISGADDKTPPPDKNAPSDKTTDKDAPKTNDKDTSRDKDTSKDNKDGKKQAKKLGENEIKIVSHVHHINMMEIDLGKIAQRTGTAPVKKYAEMIVTDHQMADKELIKFTKTRGMNTIPAEKPQTDAEKQMMKDMTDEVTALKKLKGADFDREYLRMMVKHHEEELAKTDPYIEMSQDSDLDMMLQNRKATLQRHADQAKELQKASTVSSK